MRILERRGVQFIAGNAVEPKRIGTNLSDSPVCPKWVISTGFAGFVCHLMSALPQKQPVLGRARSVVFGRTPVIQTPKLGAPNHAL